MEDEPAQERRLITSEQLSKWAVGLCWVLSLALLGSGTAATFMEKAGAAAAAMIALGGVLAVLALMKRVPLRLEVAGTKLDAAYTPPDEAYDAGREGGLAEGLAEGLVTAVEATEEAKASGHSVDELLQQFRQELNHWKDVRERADDEQAKQLQKAAPAPAADRPAAGYSGSDACRLGGVTYRQLDYWVRTGLIEPSIKGAGFNHRRFTFEDVVLIRVTHRLLETGITLQQIRAAIAKLRMTGSDSWANITMMSDGDLIYLAQTPDEVVDLLEMSKGAFGIAVGRVVQEVRAREQMDDPIGNDEGPNELLKLPPAEFEHLVSQLFEALGMKSWMTQASRDDGFDAVVTDEDPVLGETSVVHLKRSRNAVGVAAMRELADTMEDKHTSKGILVTTSHVTKGGRDFAARHGRMQIIEGPELKRLIKAYLGEDV